MICFAAVVLRSLTHSAPAPVQLMSTVERIADDTVGEFVEGLLAGPSADAGPPTPSLAKETADAPRVDALATANPEGAAVTLPPVADDSAATDADPENSRPTAEPEVGSFTRTPVADANPMVGPLAGTVPLPGEPQQDMAASSEQEEFMVAPVKVHGPAKPHASTHPWPPSRYLSRFCPRVFFRSFGPSSRAPLAFQV